ncbi:MAG: GrpB family protein [Chloroflexota bacterium]|nr:GrpB family protein [Chloroflexota bacterium]
MANTVRSDAEINAVRIGPPEVLNAQIYLAPYDPEWPQWYGREETRIRAALDERVLLLEHVGSTSIPELSAKPRIDIILGVADSGNEASYVPAMEAAGYVLRIREPDWHEHRVFKGPDSDINLHVFTAGCAEIQRMLGFRDHLRANKADRTAYEQRKQDLAKQTWKYTQHYADAKSEVVEAILAAAGIAAVCVTH